MANSGSFDIDLVTTAWFDPTAVTLGWYAWEMPFSHDLVNAEAGGIIDWLTPNSDSVSPIIWQPAVARGSAW